MEGGSMSKMFCFQCEQTAGCSGCTGEKGVCGKEEETARLQDELTGALIGLARAADGNQPSISTHRTMMEGLFATLTNVNFDNDSIRNLIRDVIREKEALIPECKKCTSTCDRNNEYDMKKLWEADPDIRSLKSLLLFGLRGMAAYAYHALVLGYTDETVNQFFYRGMFAVGEELGMDQLLPLLMEAGTVNLKCMELLDKANTESYGVPAPAEVSMNIESGPFIVVSGHDLHDLAMILEQTKDRAINIYTHGELLPAHAYSKLKSYSHLKGNFGTAWQNQQKEFDHIPAPILFTTNCLMPVKDSYRDRVFTTGVVAYPGVQVINEAKDFTPVMEKALELGGYQVEKQMTGINGGTKIVTGFGHHAILSVADKVVDEVKQGVIKHFFLVGGCDGARMGRSYFTDFVKKTPKDSIILTLACGKYRFNDLALGEIGGFPRIMDMGQCNDSYSAIKVAVALSEAFECSVNELPLSMVLSWYEQKAVCILLTLLSMGIKNIYLEPTLPAFLSENVLNYLVEHYNISPISTPEDDMKKMLKR